MTKTQLSTKEQTENIIHDLKAPIIAQIAALESILYSNSKLNEEEKDLIELTLNSCKHMQKLVDNYIVIQDLQNKSIVLNYETFNIVDIIENQLNDLKIILKYYNLNLIFIKKNPILVNADKNYITKVIENLISNSINYAFKNSQIKISCEKIENSFVFKIKTNSHHIEEKILKEVFSKTKTYAKLYNKNAVGLSLFLSNEIIQFHHGEMIAISDENEINTFGFKIPID